MAMPAPGTFEQKLLSSITFPLEESRLYSGFIPELRDDEADFWQIGLGKAGRAACMGPMVHAVCYCSATVNREMKKPLPHGSNLNPREALRKHGESIHWAVYVTSPQDSSATALASNPSNDNYLAHEACIQLIRHVEAAIAQEDLLLQVIMDSYQGQRQALQKKLKAIVPDVLMIKRADMKYPIVVLAEYVAKYVRDQYLCQWQWTEPGLQLPRDFGRGYPAGTFTKEWLNEHQDPFFGFPSLVRFGCKEIKKMMNDKKVFWSDGIEPEEEAGQKKKRPKKSKKKDSIEESSADERSDKRIKVAGQLALERVHSLF